MAWVKQVLSANNQSPLMPALSTPFFLIFGANSTSALLAPLTLMVAAIGLTFALARRVMTAPASWLTLAMLVTTPAIINYSRFYIFTAAATASGRQQRCTASTAPNAYRAPGGHVFSASRSDAFPLSRTMTISFLPTFVILTLIAIWQAEARFVAIRNAAAAAAIAFVVAAIWLLPHRNYASVGHYLTSFGYGSSSGSFGDSHSLFSYGAWDQGLAHVRRYRLSAAFSPVPVRGASDTRCVGYEDPSRRLAAGRDGLYRAPAVPISATGS